MSGPERIWAMEWRQETRGKHLVGGYTETPAYQGCTEYVRADLHAAAIARAERAEAALYVAEEALQPLAEMAARYDPEDDDGNLECWSGLAVPKIKHVRAARAAMVKIAALKGGAE